MIPPMAAQQILFNEPTRALPVGAEIHWDAVVDDDRKRSPDDRTWMSAGTICSREDVVRPGFHHYASPVIFGELQKLSSETVPVADDRVDKVLGRLTLDSDYALQAGKRIGPRR